MFGWLPWGRDFRRVGRDASAAATRTAAAAALLLPRRGRPRLRRVLEPSGRYRALLALALAGWGVWCVVAALAALTRRAGAQTIEPGLFATEDEDTRELLGFLGGLDTESSALGNMLYAFNGGILVLVAFLLLWEVVAGAIDTGREGRWRFGGWHIVRVVIAVALVAPLPGGMNGAQHLVLSLARLGGDFAAAVWSPFSAEVFGSGGSALPDPGDPRRRAVIARVLAAEVCTFVANSPAGAGGGEPNIVVTSETGRSESIWSVNYETETRVGYDGRPGSDLPPGLCGAIRYPGLPIGAPNAEDLARRERLGPVVVAAEAVAGVAAAAHRDALESVRPSLRALAAELGAAFIANSDNFGELLDVAAAIEQRGIVAAYRGALAAGMEGANTERRSALAAALEADQEEIGWLGAATVFHSVAWQSGRAIQAAQGLPEVSLPLAELETQVPAADRAVKAVLLDLGTDRLYRPAAAVGGVDAAGSPLAAGGSFEQLLGGLFNWVGLDATISVDSVNPLADLAEWGHSLIGVGLSALAALGGAATASGVLESVPVIGGGLDVFESLWRVWDSFASVVLGAVIVSGAVLAYLLPLTPFIRFLFGILAWLLNIVEALLSVTVWAAAHVSRDDPGRLTTQATRHGWTFLPGLILRPPLMLFGLLLGHAVFVAVMGLLNAVWAPALADVRTTGSVGPIGWVAYLVIYAMLAWGLATAAFRLIDILPTVVLSWIGGQATSSGDGADRIAGTAGGAASRLESLRVGFKGRSGGR